MMRKDWAACVALLLVLAPSAGHAVTEANFAARTTGDLVELCDPQPGSALASAAINFCQGFAQGAVSVEMQHDAASRSMRLFCLPTPLPTRNETLSEFVRWARAAPGRMDGPPADGLFRFLGERFPCPTNR
jgi:hypothetical protein